MQAVKVDRDKYIGGSDIPIIMGISPFKTRFDLLLEKAGLKDNDFDGNIYTEYGNIMEDKIRNNINETLYPKNPFKEDKIIDGIFRGHADGTNNDFVLEIKTTSQIYENLDNYRTYLVQLLKYMELFKKEKGILAVYERIETERTEYQHEKERFFDKIFNPNRLQIFIVDINNHKDLLNKINEACEQFIVDLEKLKENPFLTEEDLLPVDLTNQANALLKLEEQLATFKEIEKKYNEEKEKLRQAMIKSEIKKWTTPNGTQITLIYDKEDEKIEVEYFNEEKFIVENTELYSQYYNKLAEYKETKKETKKGKKGSLRITLPKSE